MNEFQPKAVLIENVPGLVSFEKGATLDAIMELLVAEGYKTDVRILYAPLYGVPQTRWRTIVIGFKNIDNMNHIFPEPRFDAPIRVNFTSRFRGENIVLLPRKIELESFVTVKNAINDLPELLNGEMGAPLKPYKCDPENSFQKIMRNGSKGVVNHEAARLSKINLQRMQHIPPGGNWTQIPQTLLPEGMKRARRSDHTKRYGRVSADGLASTILTKCDPHWGAYFHYNQDRIFTVREAARIQTFPDHFHFAGSRVEQYEQVGNAVPPLMAEALGHSLFATLSEPQQNVSLKAI